MVQLHAFEHEANPRPTRDIDLLADARQRPSVTRRLGEVLDEPGGELADPPPTDPKLGYRFEIDGQIVDILAPDGLKSPALTIGNHETGEGSIPLGSTILRLLERSSRAWVGGIGFGGWRGRRWGSDVRPAVRFTSAWHS